MSQGIYGDGRYVVSIAGTYTNERQLAFVVVLIW
jgi:hypothetical protein